MAPTSLFYFLSLAAVGTIESFKVGQNSKANFLIRSQVQSDANTLIENERKHILTVTTTIGTFGGLLLAPAIAAARQSKLDFDQKQIETRPSQTDGFNVINGIKPDYAGVRRDIKEMIEAKLDKGPTLVRLAWHSSGTYDQMTKTGGSQKGTIRFREELEHGANAGLDTAISWLEPIYKKFNKNADLSYADLFTLSGVVAVEALGGPKIGWRAGRVDSFDVEDVTEDGRLPDADKGSPAKTAAGIRQVFGRMGFSDQEIVVLSGAHALGRCHPTASGYVGPWTFTPTKFNVSLFFLYSIIPSSHRSVQNQYFVLLKGLKWTPAEKTAKFQYSDPSGKLMMLPSDIVLIEDAEFKKYVDMYAKDQKMFFSDFAKAFQKLEELGTSNLYDV